MAELGSIFDDDAALAEGAARGPDLRVEVEVPRRALGDDEGYDALVPRQLPHAGEAITRATNPHDDGDFITLRLPPTFPDGGTIKLRGQGGVASKSGGRAGDLFVTIRLTDADLPSHRGSGGLTRDHGPTSLAPAVAGIGLLGVVLVIVWFVLFGTAP